MALLVFDLLNADRQTVAEVWVFPSRQDDVVLSVFDVCGTPQIYMHNEPQVVYSRLYLGLRAHLCGEGFAHFAPITVS